MCGNSQTASSLMCMTKGAKVGDSFISQQWSNVINPSDVWNVPPSLTRQECWAEGGGGGHRTIMKKSDKGPYTVNGDKWGWLLVDFCVLYPQSNVNISDSHLLVQRMPLLFLWHLSVHIGICLLIVVLFIQMSPLLFMYGRFYWIQS